MSDRVTKVLRYKRRYIESFSIKKTCFGEVRFFGTISWWELKLYQKIAQLTERKKEQDRVHARFIGSAAAASSLAARRGRSAWQRGCTARRHWGMAAPAATNAVLPPRAAAVAMKTSAATAIAGAQTINNQLKERKRRR